MTLKRRSVKFARFLRRHCRLTLPESVKVAKWYLRHREGLAPPVVVELLEQACPVEGCCWAEVPYLESRAGFPEYLRLESLHVQYCELNVT